MRINWMAYQYREFDGYGRFSNRFIAALARAGVAVRPTLTEMVHAPLSTNRMAGWKMNGLTIQCVPVFYAVRVPGPSWLFSMTEGSELPDKWAELIAMAMPERIVVPCEYNAMAFRDGMAGIGLTIPVSIINGGTDPVEFDRREYPVGRYDGDYDYTFVALGDRGARKGWTEVWEAFYRAFGKPEETPNVRLIIKSRPVLDNGLMDMIAESENPDPRIEIWREDVEDMRDVWARADCAVLPSRSEGFGMPHREAAMTGIPVVTQAYGGIDDGFADCWSMPIIDGKTERIPDSYEHIKGEWMKADVPALADKMMECFKQPRAAARFGMAASEWLANNQTWDHAAGALIRLMEENGYGVDH